MAQTRLIQNNFTAGEWTPRLESRIDLPKYANACRTLENFLIMPHGGVSRRGGFHYVAGVKDHSRKVRLIPFEFNVEQAYILEFGHQYMRVCKNYGQVLASVDAFTKLLLHMNGADASTVFEDSGITGHTVTANGTAQIDTDYKVFGSASGLFNGIDAYLTIPDHADFDFSDGIWTVDFRFRLPVRADGTIFYHGTDSGNYLSIFVRAYTGSMYSPRLILTITEAGVERVHISTLNPSIFDGLWHHAAVAENGDNFYLFLDGALAGTATSSNRPETYTGDIYIGSTDGSLVRFLNGHLDELRVSKGIARWTSSFSPPAQEYPSPGEAGPVEIVTPYLEEDLAGIKRAQSADVMYIVNRNHAPRKLSRSSHTSWSLDVISFIDGPYRDEESTPTITPSATTGNITLTASGPLFYPGHVGALWRIKHGSTWGYVKITGVTDTTHAAAAVQSTLGGTGASSAQAEGAWSDYRGWPAAVMFHENRLWFARDLTYWASKKGDGNYENFTPGDTDEDPVSFAVNSDRVNLIRWLASSSSLMIGTAGEEFRVHGTDGFITATNIDSKSATAHGVANIDPLKVGSAVLFVQRSGRKLRELVYSLDIDGYVAPDLAILAEHISAPKVLGLEYQQEPDSTVWAYRSDGVLLSMTYLRAEDVIGWARQPTNGEVESIAVIPSPDESRNDLWIAVRRTINGEVKRYIEYLDPGIQVDSGLTYSGAPVLALSGLDHLEGRTVKVVGDGMVYNDAIVTGGAITLSPAFAASEIQVGLAYTSRLETMRPEVSLGNGTSRGMKKAWGDCFVNLYQSGGLTINGEVVPFRRAGDPLGQAVPLFTGDKRVNQLGWDRNEGRIIIEQTQPLPCTVLAVFGTLEVGG